MADKRISELTNITGANLADDDEFVVVDTSASETKAITYAELKKFNGTVTADGLTLDFGQNLTVGGTTYPFSISKSAAGNLPVTFKDTNDAASASVSFIMRAGSANERTALKIDGNNDISFYEDTGTTPKFFWDASAEALGIGTTSPNFNVEVRSAGSTTVAVGSSGATSLWRGFSINDGATEYASIKQKFNDGEVRFTAGLAGWGGFSTFYTNGTERLRIDSSGNVGIGTSSPTAGYKLDVAGNIYASAGLVSAANGGSTAYFGASSQMNFGSTGSDLIIGSSNTPIRFGSSSTNTEWMRIDSGGNVGIGVVPSAWNSVFRAIEVGRTGDAIFSGTGGGPVFSANAYYDAVQWKYGRTGSAASAYEMGSGQHLWYTAPSGTAGNAITFTQAMTLDASGNLNIDGGTGKGRITLETGASANTIFATTTAFGAYNTLRLQASDLQFYSGSSPTERMRIDASGNLLVGTTATLSGNKFLVTSDSFVAGFNVTNGTGEAVRFYSAGTAVGTISVTGSATSYNTSSDYRLKEDVQPMVGASDRVLALNPVNFAWKADGTRVDGFLAHEAQAVVPEAVTGEKDAVDADGNPQYQGIDQSKLVPLLTAALQEALTEIASLKARLDAANL